MIRLCAIQSTPVQKIGMDGSWGTTVDIDPEEAMLSGSPEAFAKHLIATALVACVKESGIPLNEGLWLVSCSPWAQRKLNLPEAFLA
jgi:hypothetical protein